MRNCVIWCVLLLVMAGTAYSAAPKPLEQGKSPQASGAGDKTDGPADAEHSAGQRIQSVIDDVEKECLESRVPMIGRPKAERLAELVRQAKPRLVVECGTAIGYSGLWIARELQAADSGRLITLEIDARTAARAEANFRKAGLERWITIQVGDARRLVKEIAGPIGFVFIDCNAPNYHPCFTGLEKNLSRQAVVVADNADLSAAGMQDYLTLVRRAYRSRTGVVQRRPAVVQAGRDGNHVALARRAAVS